MHWIDLYLPQRVSQIFIADPKDQLQDVRPVHQGAVKYIFLDRSLAAPKAHPDIYC